MVTLTVNGNTQSVDADPDTPLLWVLRDELGLVGTKFEPLEPCSSGEGVAIAICSRGAVVPR